MLPIAVVNEIAALVQAGDLSNRKIAARLGVSRGVVNAIANGKRQPYGQDPLEDAPLDSLPPSRCPTCGYRVYMPCLVCRAREHLRSKQLWALLARANRRRNRLLRKQAG